MPFITVVMPVRNESRFIRDTLGQLVAQEYPMDRFEIIVVDGMSDDGTREIVAEVTRNHPQVRIIDNPRRLSGAGRNVGFRNGRGDVFLVVDGHCFIPGPDLFKNIADCFEESGADCLGRPQPLNPPGLSRFQQSIAVARGSWLGHGGDSLIYSTFEGYCSPVSNGAAYRKEVFEKVGYLDENFDAAEDVEFNFRVEKAGMKCYTSPRLTIRYYPRESLEALFRQMKRYGMGRYRFILKHREAFSVNQLIPAVFVAGFVLEILFALGCLFSSFWLPLFLIMSLLYSIYGVIVVVESFKLAVQHGWRNLASLPTIFLAVHIGLGWGFWSASWAVEE